MIKTLHSIRLRSRTERMTVEGNGNSDRGRFPSAVITQSVRNVQISIWTLIAKLLVDGVPCDSR
jgi:hypothetical protein